MTTKTNKTNTKNKAFKKTRCRCNGKVIMIYLSIPSVLYIAWHIYFRPDQICAKCDQIAALNKSTDDFIFPSVFLSLCHFKMFITSASSIQDLIVVGIYSHSI